MTCFLLILSFIFLLTISIISGKSRTLAFPSSLFFEGERLVNHTIATISAIDRDTCEFRCYLEHNCVSINFKVRPRGPETENCELNNSTSKEHEKDLIKAANYVYHGTNVRTLSNGRKQSSRKVVIIIFYLQQVIIEYSSVIEDKAVLRKN